ncbi:MAG: hypothetical protein ABS43_14050 [Bordetella sp. SCN 67-23]|nr:glycosyltransferase family 4 protein [Burkholderiales bacterium]ODS73247.1 MAG: hypothetical protein ABS43_14050 [Bordetella sp. SCN 67-23]ODU73057.1 MAG: hypothetical protein ABT00_17025 [Bordetella sp. SCN 68-11]OJW92778.1 MAG: hypothetical protein BGO71_23760 [Burkholderiales bacterium 67-32]
MTDPLSPLADARPGVTVGVSATKAEPALRPHKDGIGTYTAALLDHLPHHGCRPVGYAWPEGRAQPILVHGSYLPHSYGLLTAGQMLGLVRPIKLNVDVFHCTDHMAFRTACPCVITLHDAAPLSHPEWASPRLRRLRNQLLARAGKLGDAYIAISQAAVAELVTHFGVDERKIHVVPNGIDPIWFETEDSVERYVRLRSRLALRERHFLFVGTLQPRKNVDRILDAYLLLPAALRREHQLLIVGRPGWRSEVTIARLQAMRDEGVIWLNDLQDDGDVRALYRHAEALVFPSLHEGFGLPVLEAFASGTPVVTSNITSLPEVAGDAAILVTPENTSEIASAMQELIRSPNTRAQCVARGLLRSRQFSLDRTASGTAEVYRSVM